MNPLTDDLRLLLLVAGIALISFAGGFYLSLPAEPPFPTNDPIAGSTVGDTLPAPADTTATVRIVGEGITNAGEYELPADSEIIDLVEHAGGLRTGAITEGLDWHKKLYDGLRITVPTRKALEAVRSGTRPLTNRDLIRFRKYTSDTDRTEDDSDRLDLNDASSEELDDLHGIGSVLSKRILDYRERNDGFDSVRELKNVFGIGDVTYQELRSRVTVQ